jgi:hypothetical protein
MAQEINIVGKNNTRVEVTGQNELLVRISDGGVTALAEALSSMGSAISIAEFFKVLGVDVDTWDAAIGFTSDAVQFTGSKSWAIQITDYNITPGTPSLTLEVSTDGLTWNSYKPQATNVDITSTDNRIIFDDIMPFGYLRIVYVSGGSTGDFSVKIAK